MNFLQTHFAWALLLPLLPILIHLAKHRLARKVVVNALWLLNRKRTDSPRRLRLKQLLLLAMRISLALALALFFLKPVMQKAPLWLSNSFPQFQDVVVLLDTTHDSRRDLLPSLPEFDGQALQMEDLSSVTLRQFGLPQAVKEKLVNPHDTVLVSRFYGVSPSQLQEWADLGVTLIAVGPKQMDSAYFSHLVLEPAAPLCGEPVVISGQIKGPAHKQLRISIEDAGAHFNTSDIELDPNGSASFILRGSFSQPPAPTAKFQINSVSGLEQSLAVDVSVSRNYRIGLIDDQSDPAIKGSRLHLIHEFLMSLNQLWKSARPIQVSWLKSDTAAHRLRELDFLVVGDVSQAIPLDTGQGALVFAQRSAQVQAHWDSHFQISALEWVKQVDNLQFIPRLAQDRGLIDQEFPIRQRMRIQANKGDVLASTMSEPVILAQSRHVFSAIDLTEDSFPWVRHPYLPIFLYRILLNRHQESATLVQDQGESRTRPDLPGDNKNPALATGADLSKPLLLFAFMFFLVETGIVLRLQRPFL